MTARKDFEKKIMGRSIKTRFSCPFIVKGNCNGAFLKIFSESTLKKSASGAYRGEEQLQRNNFEDFFQNVLKKRFYRVLIGVKG